VSADVTLMSETVVMQVSIGRKPNKLHGAVFAAYAIGYSWW